MSPKKVSNTHSSSSNDESILIFFHETKKGGVRSQIGSFIVLFYESDEIKVICHFTFRESKMTKKTPKVPFSQISPFGPKKR